MDYALLNPETNTAATFTFYGYRRVMANFSCQVVGIIENEDPVIYFVIQMKQICIIII